MFRALCLAAVALSFHNYKILVLSVVSSLSWARYLCSGPPVEARCGLLPSKTVLPVKRTSNGWCRTPTSASTKALRSNGFNQTVRAYYVSSFPALLHASSKCTEPNTNVKLIMVPSGGTLDNISCAIASLITTSGDYLLSVVGFRRSFLQWICLRSSTYDSHNLSGSSLLALAYHGRQVAEK